MASKMNDEQKFISATSFFSDSDDEINDIPVTHQKQVVIPDRYCLNSRKAVKGKSQHLPSQYTPEYVIEMISTKTIVDEERRKQNEGFVKNVEVPGIDGQFTSYRPAYSPDHFAPYCPAKNAHYLARSHRYPVVERVEQNKKPIVFQKVVLTKEPKVSQQ